MPIYIGPNKATGLFLGTREITRVWKGTDLVYQKGSPGPTEWTLFDHGWVDGVSWSGNMLPRPQYTSLGTYDFSNVESDGFMRLSVASAASYSQVNHNCHVCVSAPITVPSGATKLCVSVAQNRAAGDFMYQSVYLKFGLLTQNAVNSMDAANGGQLSGFTEISSTAPATHVLTLDAGIAGQSFLPIVNMRRNARGNETGHLYIYKVWFE